MSAKRPLIIILGFAAQASATAATTLQDLPRGARAGECFSHLTIPATYRTERHAVPQPPAVSWREVSAVYKTVTRQVLAAPGRVEHEIIPAVLGTRMHWAEHSGPDRIVSSPPVYRWEMRRVLVRPAHLEWRAGQASGGYGEGSGDGVRVRPTGEVMCRVMVAARYEVRRIRVLITPARDCVVKGPSTRERIVEHIVVTPARVVEHKVQPVYHSISERVLVSPARRDKVETPRPPSYVGQRVLVAPAHTVWRKIACAPKAPGRPRPTPAAYGQPDQPSYAQPRPGDLDGAPTYRAPAAGQGYGQGPSQ